jgi:hypothetical protein
MFRTTQLLFRINDMPALEAKEKPDKIGLQSLWRVQLGSFRDFLLHETPAIPVIHEAEPCSTPLSNPRIIFSFSAKPPGSLPSQELFQNLPAALPENQDNTHKGTPGDNA